MTRPPSNGDESVGGNVPLFNALWEPGAFFYDEYRIPIVLPLLSDENGGKQGIKHLVRPSRPGRTDGDSSQ